MTGNFVKFVAAASVALATSVFVPVASAQTGRTQVASHCDETRAGAVRPASARSVAQRSTVRSVEEAPERSKTKSALMIGGAAAAGAGVGGAISGTKGALIGAAIGGGSASIYEAAKRR